MAKKPTKTETLTIRMDPKTRFMLEFVSRLKGQTITTVVERAISAAADSAFTGNYNNGITWRNFWSVNEGERALMLAGESDLHPTWEEERRLDFTKRFWPFFYKDRNGKQFQTPNLEVLWPRIDEIIEHHENHITTNANASPEYMSKMLEEAQLPIPQWPPMPQKTGFDDFDADIPF